MTTNGVVFTRNSPSTREHCSLQGGSVKYTEGVASLYLVSSAFVALVFWPSSGFPSLVKNVLLESLIFILIAEMINFLSLSNCESPFIGWFF